MVNKYELVSADLTDMANIHCLGTDWCPNCCSRGRSGSQGRRKQGRAGRKDPRFCADGPFRTDRFPRGTTDL